MKTLFNFRLGGSKWSLSLGEYVCLLFAVFCGWFAGNMIARETVLPHPAFVEPIHHGTNPGQADFANLAAPTAE